MRDHDELTRLVDQIVSVGTTRAGRKRIAAELRTLAQQQGKAGGVDGIGEGWKITTDRLGYVILRDAGGREVIKSATGNDEAVFLKFVQRLALNAPPPAPQHEGPAVDDAMPRPLHNLLHFTEHCISAAEEGVDYAAPREWLDAMTTMGIMEKVGRGKWAPTDHAQAVVRRLRAALAPQPKTEDMK